MAARKENQKNFDNLRLMPIVEAAERYYCSRRKLELEIKAKNIDSYKFGKSRLIDLDSADAFFMTKHSATTRTRGVRKR